MAKLPSYCYWLCARILFSLATNGILRLITTFFHKSWLKSWAPVLACQGKYLHNAMDVKALMIGTKESLIEDELKFIFAAVNNAIIEMDQEMKSTALYSHVMCQALWSAFLLECVTYHNSGKHFLQKTWWHCNFCATLQVQQQPNDYSNSTSFEVN